MIKINDKQKWVFLFLGLALYIAFMFANFGTAYPAGADVSYISNSSYSATPGSRSSDPGGQIVVLNLDTTQQLAAWKAYVGNITGTLVLRNSDGWSIFEWSTNSSNLQGNVFVTRNNSVSWANLVCANNTAIATEQTFLGISTSSSYSINNTFNYTAHKQMNISGMTPIANSTCPSTATYVNGSAQTVTESAYFQEILLYDTHTLIYGTFIDQDAWAFSNNDSVNGTNVTYDFQLIVAENQTSSGTTYYFYADIA